MRAVALHLIFPLHNAGFPVPRPILILCPRSKELATATAFVSAVGSLSHLTNGLLILKFKRYLRSQVSHKQRFLVFSLGFHGARYSKPLYLSLCLYQHNNIFLSRRNTFTDLLGNDYLYPRWLVPYGIVESLMKGCWFNSVTM